MIHLDFKLKLLVLIMKTALGYFGFLIFIFCAGCERNDETAENISSEPPSFLAPPDYEIIQQARGDLNQDNELDTVLAIKKLNNSSLIEIVLYSGMSEEKRTNSIIPFRLNTEGTISLAIENYELIISTQEPAGIVKSRFRYFDKKLTLVKIEKSTNDYLLTLDLLNSKIEESDAPARTFDFSDAYFEDANPESIIQNTIDELHTKSINAGTITNSSDVVPFGYRVIEDTEGDLNEDGLADKVIAIQNKADKTETITTVVLLKQQDSTFQEDAESRVVIPPEMSTDDTQLFDSVSLTIENNELIVGVSRFTSNTQSHFSYMDGQLTLTKIEQFASGAGEHYSSSIDLLNSTIEETRTNTMDETMPSETTTQSFHLPIIYFEKADPDTVIAQALKGHQKQSITGVLIFGGGIDDNSVTIQTDDGNEINAYCDGKCGDWFVDDIEGNTGGTILDESLKGKKVSAVIATETSNGRIAGPGDDEEFVFVKEIEFIDEQDETPFAVPDDYKILQDAEGDLNEDGFTDRVIAIQKKTDKTELIKTILLLGQANSHFKKHLESVFIIPPEISSKNIQMFDSLSLKIKDKGLIIAIRGGAAASSEIIFRYNDGQLVLVEFKTFNSQSNYPLDMSLLDSPVYFENAYLDSLIRKARTKIFSGTLIDGNGLDKYFVIQTDDGNKVKFYCVSCKDFFLETAEGFPLKESEKNRKLSRIEVVTEANNGKISGHSEDEELPFIYGMTFVEKVQESLSDE